MRLIKPSFEIFEQGPGLQGIYEAIERAGRTCYKSQAKYQYRNPHTDEVYAPDFVGTWKVDDDRIGVTTTAEDFYRKEGIFIKESSTAKGFVDRMITSQHYAMLEHGTVYLFIPWNKWYDKDANFRYFYNKYSVHHRVENVGVYITTNYRVIVENDWLEDLKFLCEPTEFHERRITVRFTTDRGVSHEFVRHRVFSFAQESTRYCNYSKDKFGGELTFIEPSWDMTLKPSDYGEDRSLPFLLSNIEIEYNHLINDCGWKPQQARMILPNCIKTELVMTGFTSDWNHFFDLRARGTTGAPHPDAKALAEPLMGEFYKRGYIK